MSRNTAQDGPDAATEVAFNRRWGESVFSERPAALSTSRFAVVHEDGAGETKVGRCAAGTPLRMAGRTYERGIGVNSHSVVRLDLTEPAERFVAGVGIDDNVARSPASVRFRVQVDGQDVFATDVMRPTDGVRTIDVSLNGARTFDLVVDDGGDGRAYDQADWADARVLMQDGAQVWIDDIARTWRIDSVVPFSFVFGGKHSSAFLDGWDRTERHEAVDHGSYRRTVTFADPDTGLEVSAAAIFYADSPGVDWTLHFTNTGSDDTPIIEQVNAVDVTITSGPGAAPELHQLRGSTNALEDWHPYTEQLPVGRRVDFASTRGKTSDGISPFFDVQWPGGGVITAMGWSGQWRGTVEHLEGGAIRLDAGMEFIHLKLRPGESVRSPRVLQLYWHGDDLWRAYNLFRRTMVNHVVPTANGKTVTPPIAHLSTSFYELNDSTEENVLSHFEAIKGLGFEVFWLDAYWVRDGFPYGVGHYGFPIQRVEPPDRFPRGLRPIGDAAAGEGMGFLVWFLPEAVAADTLIARESPEWVISLGDEGTRLFNLGIPEAQRYMTDYLKEVVQEYRLTWLRFDYGFEPLPFWQHLDAQDPDREGITEIRYMEGLYRMWDEIRETYPHLAIDNCAGGGRRIDLETCSRSIPLWRTDGTIGPLFNGDFDNAALRNQIMTAGLSRYVPFSASGQMGATPYHFRSGYNAGISFCEDCRPEDYPRDLLKQAIAEGKRIRKYYFGNFYLATDASTSTKEWYVFQYHRQAEQDGMVVAFRRDESPYTGFECALREIDADADYEVTFSSAYEPSPPGRMTGDQLRSTTLPIPARPGSLLVEYRRLDR